MSEIQRISEGPRTEAAAKAIKKLRNRLLDITNRNKLINFKHSDKSRNHVRIIDELPDELMKKLDADSKLTFKSLPEPKDEPEDEKNDIFQLALEEARSNDPIYLEAISKLEEDGPSSKRGQQIERDLKDRVREDLGMGKRAHTDVMSIADYARVHGFEPSYDLPNPGPAQVPEHHIDNEIQNLFLPDQMERKLSGIAQEARISLYERGINTLYIAFGFLEWYESRDSTKSLLAPLLLKPIEIERKLVGDQYKYKIFSTGEETQVNLTLSERLANDFHIRLPDYLEEDTPESYFEKINQICKPRWRVRRFVTIGHFAFARLVMYKDLDSVNWPEGQELHTHPNISALLGGSNIDSGFCVEPYNVDQPEIAYKVPYLISDADSSQYSAIVDIMDGHNMAIEGPPGTGKSQTITNVIGAALAQGKRVLFVAEKMAALEVVKNRLDAVGLGEFVLELHSTKARKKDLLQSFLARLDIHQNVSHSSELNEALYTFENLKKQLTRYVELLNTSFGKLGKTIHEILWRELRASYENEFPIALNKVDLQNVADITPYSLEENKSILRIVEEYEQTFSEDYGKVEYHPWYGSYRTNISPFDHTEIITTISNWINALEKIESDLEQIPVQIDSLKDARRLANSAKELPVDIGNNSLFALLSNKEITEALNIAVENLKDWTEKRNWLSQYCRNPDNLEVEHDWLEELGKEVNRLGLNDIIVGDMPPTAEQRRNEVARWRDLDEFARQLLILFNLEGSPNFHRLGPLLKAGQLAERADRENRKSLLLRTPQLIDETSADILERGQRKLEDLRSRKEELAQSFILSLENENAPTELRKHAEALRRDGLFSGLSKDVRLAKSRYKQLARNPKGNKRQSMADHLESIAGLIKEIQNFDSDNSLREICGHRFEGIDTDFNPLLDVNHFANRVRSELAGINPEHRAARRLLLEGDMTTIDDLIAMTRDARYSRLSNSITKLEQEDKNLDPVNMADRCEEQANTIDSLYSQAQNQELYASISLGSIPTVKEQVLEMHDAHMAVKNNNIAMKTLDDIELSYLVHPDEDYSCLSLAYKAALTIHDLDLPEKIRNYLFYSNYAERREIIVQVADSVFKDLENINHAAGEAEELAQIDSNRFFGSDRETLSIHALVERLHRAENEPNALSAWAQYVENLNEIEARGLLPILNAFRKENRPLENLELAYERVVYRSLARKAYDKYTELNKFSGVTQEEARRRFQETDKKLLELQQQALRADLDSRDITPGNSEGLASDRTDLGLINAEIRKKKRHIPIRELLDRAENATQELKPCFMMSPLSVSQYLKPGCCEFDLLVIDEASQMKPEEALGSLARAAQTVVVGDPKQLPPTNFFDRMERDNPEEDDEEATDAQNVESILETAMSCWHPHRRLLWHYRSRHESLIAFSNEKFYHGELIVFPSPIIEQKDYGVQSEFVGGTCRKGGTNREEARRIAEEAISFMCSNSHRSLGLVAMNKAQTDLIHDEINRRLKQDQRAYDYVEKWEESNGGLERFFIKNLENVQGDERDVIFISVTYGPDPESGKVFQRFGPINTDVGYRRLNVLFTRAKENIKLFTSMRPADVNVNDINVKLGRRALHEYLEYAATGRLHGGNKCSGNPESDFEKYVKSRLEERGFNVTCQVGVAGYYIDLAIGHPAYPNGYIAGVECDGATYHSALSARDRDRLRQEVLENLGWDILRVWSTDWFADPDTETARLDQKLRELLRNKSPQSNPDKNKVYSSEEDNQIVNNQNNEETEHDSQTVQKIAESDIKSVEIGDLVTYEELGEDLSNLKTVQISTRPSFPEYGVINYETPIASALIDSKVGETFTVNLPKGKRKIIIKEIKKNRL